uniref:Uncharacterized protein n=1 Tax=Ciona intestinalis TaxID=7719 RepID=H2Y0Q3_CIOIN
LIFSYKKKLKLIFFSMGITCE